MLFRTILFVLLLFHLPSVANHAIYISVIEIDEKTLSIKVFSDDLVDAMKNYNPENVIIGQLFVSNNQRHIERYFNEKCKLVINEKSMPLALENFKIEGDASFLKFTFKNESNWSTLTLQADYFMELFPDQSNVLTVVNGDQKRYARLTKSKPNCQITFD